MKVEVKKNIARSKKLKLKPSEYLDIFYPGSNITPRTVTNWIKSKRIDGERTATGRWLVVVSSDSPKAIVRSLGNSDYLLSTILGE